MQLGAHTRLSLCEPLQTHVCARVLGLLQPCCLGVRGQAPAIDLTLPFLGILWWPAGKGGGAKAVQPLWGSSPPTWPRLCPSLQPLPALARRTAPARSRNHVSCHYLHYLDWEQSLMSPSIIVPLPGDAEEGGEEREL